MTYEDRTATEGSWVVRAWSDIRGGDYIRITQACEGVIRTTEGRVLSADSDSINVGGAWYVCPVALVRVERHELPATEVTVPIPAWIQDGGAESGDEYLREVAEHLRSIGRHCAAILLEDFAKIVKEAGA